MESLSPQSWLVRFEQTPAGCPKFVAGMANWALRKKRITKCLTVITHWLQFEAFQGDCSVLASEKSKQIKWLPRLQFLWRLFMHHQGRTMTRRIQLQDGFPVEPRDLRFTIQFGPTSRSQVHPSPMYHWNLGPRVNPCSHHKHPLFCGTFVIFFWWFARERSMPCSSQWQPCSHGRTSNEMTGTWCE